MNQCEWRWSIKIKGRTITVKPLYNGPPYKDGNLLQTEINNQNISKKKNYKNSFIVNPNICFAKNLKLKIK